MDQLDFSGNYGISCYAVASAAYLTSLPIAMTILALKCQVPLLRHWMLMQMLRRLFATPLLFLCLEFTSAKFIVSIATAVLKGGSIPEVWRACIY